MAMMIGRMYDCPAELSALTDGVGVECDSGTVGCDGGTVAIGIPAAVQSTGVPLKTPSKQIGYIFYAGYISRTKVGCDRAVATIGTIQEADRSRRRHKAKIVIVRRGGVAAGSIGIVGQSSRRVERRELHGQMAHIGLREPVGEGEIRDKEAGVAAGHEGCVDDDDERGVIFTAAPVVLGKNERHLGLLARPSRQMRVVVE